MVLNKLLIWAIIGLAALSIGLFSWGKYNSFLYGTSKAKINAVKAQIEGLITEKNVHRNNFKKLNEAIKKHVAEGGCDIPFVIDDDDDGGSRPWFPIFRDTENWKLGDELPANLDHEDNIRNILKDGTCSCTDGTPPFIKCVCTDDKNCGCSKRKEC